MNLFGIVCADAENPTKKEIFAGLMSLALVTQKRTKVEIKPEEVEDQQEAMEEKLDDGAVTQEMGAGGIMEIGMDMNVLQQGNLRDGIGFGEMLTKIKKVVCMTSSKYRQPMQESSSKTLQLEPKTYEAKPQLKQLMQPNFSQQFGDGGKDRLLGTRYHLTGKLVDVYKEAGRTKSIVGFKFMRIQFGVIWKKEKHADYVKVRSFSDLGELVLKYQRQEQPQQQQIITGGSENQ